MFPTDSDFQVALEKFREIYTFVSLYIIEQSKIT